MTPEKSRTQSRAPILIGVAGGTAAGKSAVVREVVRGVGSESVAVIEHDSYYRDQSRLSQEQRLQLNYDHPDALETSLLKAHLRQLIEGSPVEVPTYSFSTHTRLPTTRRVVARKVIVLVGVLILVDPELRELLDIRAYVDADEDIRLIRRLRRDIAQRGRSLDTVIHQYLDSVKPMHRKFVEPSKRHAHFILPEGAENRVAVDLLVSKIQSVLAG